MVVSSPATSTSSRSRRTWSVHALSLPLLQERRIFLFKVLPSTCGFERRKKRGRGRPRHIFQTSTLGVHQFHSVNGVPAGRSFQLAVDVVDVLHAFGFQPLAERCGTLLGIDGDAVLPGRAAAEHTVELHARFAGEFQSLAELGVADPGREINERLGCDAGRLVEVIASFFVYAFCPPNDLVPSTNFMFTGTSTFSTSTP